MEYLLQYLKRNHTFSDVSALTDEQTVEELSKGMTKTVLPVTLIIAFESVFGIVGNIFILIIYCKWYKICNFRCFVLYIAFIDLTSCLTTLPGEIISQTNWYSYKYDALCKTKSFFNVFTVWASGLVLFFLAYDRYRKICHPLSWQIPVYMSARLCFFCIVFAAAIASPTAVFWGIQTYDYEVGNDTVTVSICEKADGFAYDLVPFFYVLCAFVTPMFLIIIATIVLNICTGRKLLIGLKFSNEETQRSHPNGLNVQNDDRSFQFSSQERMNGDVPSKKSTRRYTFPTGNLSLKRRQLMHKVAHLKYSRHRLEDIPERDMNFSEETVFSNTFPRRKAKLCHKKHLSDSDVDDPGSVKRLDLWRDRILRQKYNTRRRKTLIMLILTGVFIFTITLYLGLVCLVANTKGILRTLSNSEKVVFFFFWRLYFVNSLINPVLYGFMDQRFRRGLVRLVCGKKYYNRTRRDLL